MPVNTFDVIERRKRINIFKLGGASIARRAGGGTDMIHRRQNRNFFRGPRQFPFQRATKMKLKPILCVMVLAALTVSAIADEVDDLILDLKYGTPDAREDAAIALGEIGDPRAVDPLIVALEDESYYVQMYASDALGYIGDLRAVEPLCEALKDDGSFYSVVDRARTSAAMALGRIGDPRAVDPLIVALEDKDHDVGLYAAWAWLQN